MAQGSKVRDDSIQDQINIALEIRDKHNFSFWDCICSTFINKKNYSKILLRQVFHHNYNKDIISIDRCQFTRIDQYLDNHKSYAILSKVNCKNNIICHLPLIDFHCASNNTNIFLRKILLISSKSAPVIY